ncbi:hypothetical protein BJP40_19960 [Streptomyces sp. CC53]|uniref:hypothetical protein n=1 Tax=unclassified Streptomyces TaxID=2593676 RepID=UPI0008DDA0C6|nr:MULTISPECIES: hypothetical protein [unclassified Streptomyces]OII64616.1 hypothetical protein BJP40_19960 [Streptomyces sp. CC53]
MGIRLFVEVLDHAPRELTHREAYVLSVLAEDANDDTRTTWNSVERPETLYRAKVSRSQMYVVLKSLMEKGALERATAGQKNANAKYRIPQFTTAQHPEKRDIDAPSQRPGNRDTDNSQRPGIQDTDAPAPCPENRDTDTSQCPEIRDLSVPKSGTPTPHPLRTTPSSQPEGQPASATAVDYGIPTDARPLVDALTLVGISVRWPFKGDQWFPLLALIAKCGIPALVDHAQRAVARNPQIDSARYFLPGWRELPPLPAPGAARPPLRAVSGGWQPYTNPTDHSVYENGW